MQALFYYYSNLCNIIAIMVLRTGVNILTVGSAAWYWLQICILFTCPPFGLSFNIIAIILNGVKALKSIR